MTISLEEIHREILRDPESAAGYLGSSLDDGDDEDVRRALKNLIEAQEGGIPAFAKRLGLGQDALNALLSTEGGPNLASVRKIVRGLGLYLAVEPQASAAACPEESTGALSAGQPKPVAQHAEQPAV